MIFIELYLTKISKILVEIYTCKWENFCFIIFMLDWTLQ